MARQIMPYLPMELLYRPSVKFPDSSFPAVECHGSSLFYLKSIELKPAEFIVPEGQSSGLTLVARRAGRQPGKSATASKSRDAIGRKSAAGSHSGTRVAQSATHSAAPPAGRLASHASPEYN